MKNENKRKKSRVTPGTACKLLEGNNKGDKPRDPPPLWIISFFYRLHFSVVPLGCACFFSNTRSGLARLRRLANGIPHIEGGGKAR